MSDHPGTDCGSALDMNCVLCGTGKAISTFTVKGRHFYRCTDCELLFVPSEYHLAVAEERSRYELHDNTLENDGYVRFLSQVADIAERVMRTEGLLLDFGCGKNAVLATILHSRGVQCDVYDPLYDFPPLEEKRTYEGIILCEVIEHCRDLPETIGLIDRLIADQGLTIIRTQCYQQNVDLQRWWYAQDPTHINLFSRSALEVVASQLRRSLEVTNVPDIFLIR
jgi:hypothetical protein